MHLLSTGLRGLLWLRWIRNENSGSDKNSSIDKGYMNV